MFHSDGNALRPHLGLGDGRSGITSSKVRASSDTGLSTGCLASVGPHALVYSYLRGRCVPAPFFLSQTTRLGPCL
jgi:hypothetical protein